MADELLPAKGRVRCVYEENSVPKGISSGAVRGSGGSIFQPSG